MAHSGDLAGVLAELGRLRARLDTLDGLPEHVQDLTGQVQAVGEAIEDLDRRDRATKPPPAWWPGLPSVDQDELAQRWDEFTAWLREVLASRYPENARKLCWCWAQHPVAVDALTSLWLTWQATYCNRSADARDGADWHTRWRPELVNLAAEELEDCRRKSTGGQRIHVQRDDLPPDLLASFETIQDRPESPR